MDEEELGAMPPLPRPHAPPKSVISFSNDSKEDGVENEDVAAVPAPHAHPLAGFQTNDSSADLGLVPGGYRSQLFGKRLNPAFINREKVDALAQQEEVFEKEDENETKQEIIEYEHGDGAQVASTRAIAAEMERVNLADVAVSDLDEEEREYAATEAASRRPYLRYQESMYESEDESENEALNRARRRKVGKQVDTAWLEQRQDMSNRPTPPLLREDEQYVREKLYRTDPRALLSKIGDGVSLQSPEEWNRKQEDSVFRRPLPILVQGPAGIPGSLFFEKR